MHRLGLPDRPPLLPRRGLLLLLRLVLWRQRVPVLHWGLWRRRALLLRLLLLDRSLLSSRRGLWRRLDRLLRALQAGPGLLGVL